MSFLKQTSGAKIYISTLPYTQNIQICHIEGRWQLLARVSLSSLKCKAFESQLFPFWNPSL